MSYEQFVLKMHKKTPRSLSEAFNNAEWCSPIIRPKQNKCDGFGAFLGGLAFVVIFAYCFWRTLGN